MEKILSSPKIKKILRKHKKKLEKDLDITIKEEKNEVTLEGNDAYNEYLGRNILEAIDMGFKVEESLMLLHEDYMFEQMNIRDYARPSRVKTVKGRVIGREGKAKKVVEGLTDCSIVVHDNIIGIIGKTENVDLAVKAVRSILLGSPHSSVYALLEKSQGRLKEAKREQEEFEEEMSKKEK